MLSGGTLSNAPSGTQMVPSSSDLISAISHPTRRRILRAFVAEPLRHVSASELAEALEQPVRQVGYHLKTLAHCEVLRLSRDGDRDAAEQPHQAWSLVVEPDWLGRVLDIWAEPRAAGWDRGRGGARAGVSGAPRRP